MEIIKKFFKEESGASLVEYALLVALIAVAVIVTVWAIGIAMNNQFANIRDCIQDPANCGAG